MDKSELIAVTEQILSDMERFTDENPAKSSGRDLDDVFENMSKSFEQRVKEGSRESQDADDWFAEAKSEYIENFQPEVTVLLEEYGERGFDTNLAQHVNENLRGADALWVIRSNLMHYLRQMTDQY